MHTGKAPTMSAHLVCGWRDPLDFSCFQGVSVNQIGTCRTGSLGPQIRVDIDQTHAKFYSCEQTVFTDSSCTPGKITDPPDGGILITTSTATVAPPSDPPPSDPPPSDPPLDPPLSSQLPDPLTPPSLK